MIEKKFVRCWGLVMLLIRIIEDNKNDYQNLKTQLLKYAFSHDVELKTEVIHDYQHLNLRTAPEDVAVYFMDIQLGASNGIELAKELRQYQQNTKIVFVSAFPEYVFDTFVVHPEYFLRKPIDYTELEKVMLALTAELTANNEEELTVKAVPDNSVQVIKLQRLKAIKLLDSDKRLLQFITTDQEILARGRLDHFKNVLNDLAFYQSYRNTIVNLSFIQKIDHDEIELDSGERLPLAATKRSELLKKFIVFRGQN